MGAVCGRPSREGSPQRPAKRSPTKGQQPASGGPAGAAAAAAVAAAVPPAAIGAVAGGAAAGGAVGGAEGGVEAPRPVTPSRVDEPTEEGRTSAASTPRSHPLPPGAEGLLIGSSSDEEEAAGGAPSAAPPPQRATVRPMEPEISSVDVVPAGGGGGPPLSAGGGGGVPAAAPEPREAPPVPSPEPARRPGAEDKTERAPPPAAAVAAALGGGALPSAAAAEAYAASARAALAAGVPGEFLLRGAPIAMAADATSFAPPAPTPTPATRAPGAGGGLPGKPASVVTRLASGAEPRASSPQSSPSPAASRAGPPPATPPPSPAAGVGPGAAALGLEAAEEFPEVPTIGPGTKGAVGTADHRFAHRRAASAPPPKSKAATATSEAASAVPAASPQQQPSSGVFVPGTVRRAAEAYGAAAVSAAADVNVTLWRNGDRTAPPVTLNKARMRARKHAGNLLATVQEAMDIAAADGRGPPKVAKRVYSLDAQQVTSVEQLASNAHYLVCGAEALNMAALPAALEEALQRAAPPQQPPQRAATGAPAELTAASSRQVAQAAARESSVGRNVMRRSM